MSEDQPPPIVEYASARDGAAARDSLRRFSFISFLGGLVGGVLTVATLFIGFGLGGAGHGDWTIWGVGLIIWLISWLVLLASCLAGIAAWARSGRPAWWTIPALVLLVAAGALGLWGLQG